jgi:type II restriction/modification system DNA methylase subunit YeeA
MDNPAARLAPFVRYVRDNLTGDEKGEAQVFCDRLFQAFGHPGIFEAGGTLEYRVHKGKGTKFADLLWRPRLLLEMKKRGERLERHYQQALQYWMYLVPNRPEYVVLCNFDEFWVYNLNHQLDEPMDRVKLDDLPRRYTALNFLFPEAKKPLFNNDRVAVTRKAADKVAEVFNRLVSPKRDKPVPRDKAQRFVLQCVIALFAQSIELLPRGLFSELLDDCKKGGSTYDLLGALFRQMASEQEAEGGRFQGVRYFNGGLFNVVEPIELSVMERTLLAEAAAEDRSRVKPPIFGTLFEGSMDQKERHAFGAHFTSEADIQKVVLPTVVRPWRQRIDAARTDRELRALRDQLLHYRVLDPACGSGNFLYIAYRELKRIEMELLDRLGEQARAKVEHVSAVSAGQFFGIDIKPFAVELAKVTLMLAKKLALDERAALISQRGLSFESAEAALPLDNLDKNIFKEDALFCDWPKADAIIGNPPYLGSRYLAKEHGYEYARKVQATFADVPKMADYCVYWFRRAHDALPEGGRAGLVATNTIRQNETREGSLDYVVAHGGTITEAVSTQVWSGEASVHVSIVNWVKGECPGPKKLFAQKGDDANGEWAVEEVETISSTLSTRVDVTGAADLKMNGSPKRCYVGQYPFNEGFLLTPETARDWIASDLRSPTFSFRT